MTGIRSHSGGGVVGPGEEPKTNWLGLTVFTALPTSSTSPIAIGAEMSWRLRRGQWSEPQMQVTEADGGVSGSLVADFLAPDVVGRVEHGCRHRGIPSFEQRAFYPNPNRRMRCPNLHALMFRFVN